MNRAGRNEHQKEFVRLFNGLCGKYNRHEVWQDFVRLAATAISNGVDKRYAEQREERYMSTIGKYAKNEQSVFPDLFALIVLGMEEAPDQDFLGELYMELKLGNDHAGQFFTPYDVCRAMAMVTLDRGLVQHEIERQGYFSLNDPACGADATLVAAANVLREWGINYQQTALFVAQDIDYTVGLMCYIQLSLLGCAGYVRIGNTLTDPMTGSVLHGGSNDDRTWFTPMYMHPTWQLRRSVDAVKRFLGSLPGKATEDPSQTIEEEPLCQSAQDEKSEGRAVATAEQDAPALIEIGKKKRRRQSEGQLMFDLSI